MVTSQQGLRAVAARGEQTEAAWQGTWKRRGIVTGQREKRGRVSQERDIAQQRPGDR